MGLTSCFTATLPWLSEPGQRQGTASARCLPWPVTDPALGFGFLPAHQSCRTFRPFPAGLSPALSCSLPAETFTDALKTQCCTDTARSHAPHPAASLGVNTTKASIALVYTFLMYCSFYILYMYKYALFYI